MIIVFAYLLVLRITPKVVGGLRRNFQCEFTLG